MFVLYLKKISISWNSTAFDNLDLLVKSCLLSVSLNM